ncbi:MAG: cyclase family protein [Patescibacteria group bacterium]|nr:cyclase family protein [Patescibacteria group bacterium]MDE2590905.1 cyclase family protein [Patescibacteria group bacterium]
MNFIDLTIPLGNDTPVYPGDPAISVSPMLTIEKDGVSIHSISVHTHAGTHMDAPSHMIQNGKTLAAFSPDAFVGKGICIDLLNAYTIEKLASADISHGDIVLLYSGWDKKRGSEEYFTGAPAVSLEMAEYLVSKKVKIVGMDSPSADGHPYAAHKKLLENDILIIEALTNLDRLLNVKFRLYAFPLPIDTDGAPMRVIAETLGEI